MSTMARRLPISKRFLPVLIIVLAAVGLYGILPQFGSFANSLEAVRGATKSLVVAALLANAIAYVCATCIYMSLALKPLRFGRTLIVQLSGLLINRIIPAGIGGLGLNFLYLRRHKHGSVQAGAVVALNNGIGLVGHVLLLLGILLISPFTTVRIHFTLQQSIMVVGGLIVLIVAALFIARLWRQRWQRTWRQLRATVKMYKKHPGKLVLALLFSWGLTLSNVLSLWACAQAVGVSVSFLVIFIVFSVGVLVGTAVPTPGGLGGLEAAIVAGLVAQHVDAALALAAVLLYRLLSFWLGLLVGAVATFFMQRQHLLLASAGSSRR